VTAAAQPSEPDGEERFWSLAQPLLTLPGVASSTMMSLPCLRVRGHFFASADPRTGHLLVKLSEARVTQLLDAGQAEPFSPAGRRFRQWAAIPPAMASTWRPLIGEALAFAEQLPGKPGQVGDALPEEH
jgi:hypothetical protein